MRHLIIDSGASKTEWVYFDGSEHHTIRTSGIHPYYLEQTSAFQEFTSVFSSFLKSESPLSIDSILYFGTGCADEKSRSTIRERLDQLMADLSIGTSQVNTISIEVESDVTGAARATFPDSEGVMFILGTGSIIARVNQGKIVDRIPSMGYIFGDEGSAAYLGKLIYSGFYRKIWSEETLNLIQMRAGLKEYGVQMREVYSMDKPASHLGHITKLVFSGPIPKELEFVLKQEFLHALRLGYELLKDEIPLNSKNISKKSSEDGLPVKKLPIALAGGIIQAHSDLALECANKTFRDHSITLYSSFAMPISKQIVSLNSETK